MMRLPVLPVPSGFVLQPVDTGDFAGYLDQRISAGPGGDVDDFGGPEVLGMDAVVEAYQKARALHRRVLRVSLPQTARRTAEAGLVTGGRRGTTTWSQWLAHTYGAGAPGTGDVRQPGTGDVRQPGTGDAGSVHLRAGFPSAPHHGMSGLKKSRPARTGADSPS